MSDEQNPAGAPAHRPPERPPLSDETPAPVALGTPPTLPVIISRMLWFASFASGVAAIVFAFVYRNAQIDEVRALIVDLQPEALDETIDTVTYVVFAASVVALLLVILIEFALVRRMMSQRGGVRWALILMAIPHAGAAALVEGFVTFGNEGVLIAALVAAQAVLAAIGLAVSFLPAANRWFRARKAGSVRAADEEQDAVVD